MPCQVCQYVFSQMSISSLICRSYLSQRHDSLDVGVADVEVGDFLRLPGSGLHAGRVLHGPVQSLGGHQVDHVVHLKFQLHHLVRRTVQPTEADDKDVMDETTEISHWSLF